MFMIAKIFYSLTYIFLKFELYQKYFHLILLNMFKIINIIYKIFDITKNMKLKCEIFI
jgi:hypothetical protein